MEDTMGAKSRPKGRRGELEAMAILQAVVNEEYHAAGVPAPELTKAGSGGGWDIKGLRWAAPEIKRHEPPKIPGTNNRLGELTPAQIADWWDQCKRNAGTEREPFLMYRMNNRPWTVRMFGCLVLNSPGQSRVRCPVDISLEAFIAWFRLRLRQDLAEARK